MPAISQDLQKTTGRRTALIVFAIAAAALGISAYIYAESNPPDTPDTCLAAHAADYGITTQQLTRDVSHQSELVAAVSSCYGMTP
ncbi:hypothetical protein SAMN04515620_105153 [Collimonas sp. OK607]|uniref:hypothetical protein n=1 Tax=Collimonas sp. OK607 TaxID=1798194 RepID=UPI0008E0467B|nr:hypothetical protein [Collimonas sp. OK607]SFA86159.1 hypothetical protein SAMN04515620_105153 [Collimonas sp. OK607]